MQFWTILGLYDPFKGPFHYQRSTLKSSYSPKSLHKFILPENLSTSKFREVEIKEICPKVVYQVILAIMGPYDPLKSPLHYQQSTLQDSYSPKILHKIGGWGNAVQISVFFNFTHKLHKHNVL